LISFPQCGHFIAPEYRTVRSLHDEFQKTPLPDFLLGGFSDGLHVVFANLFAGFSVGGGF
jgi:hypothetical protein